MLKHSFATALMTTSTQLEHENDNHPVLPPTTTKKLIDWFLLLTYPQINIDFPRHKNRAIKDNIKDMIRIF